MGSGKEIVENKPRKAKAAVGKLDVRETILRASGITEGKMAGLLKEAILTIQTKLKATDTKFFSHHGEVIETREVENHSIQLAAATELIRLTSSLAALAAPKDKGDGGVKGPVNISINVPEGVTMGNVPAIPGAALAPKKAEPIDVTPTLAPTIVVPGLTD